MKRISVFLIVACLLISVTPLNVSADETQDIPANAQATGSHGSLVAALEHANLVTALQAEGPFTVFAPTDAAFAAAGIDLANFDTDEANATLADILLYHVYDGSVAASAVTDGLTVTMLNGDNATFAVQDGAVSVGGANVTTADVMASNGIIHVIDAVLMPPVEIVEPELVDIPAVATSTGAHDSLVAALTKANLVAALQADGPFTVFAPTDEAFTAAGINLDDFVTDEQIATLSDILLYHVYNGSVAASAVTDGLTVTMLNGDDATFTVADGAVSVGGANVTTADVTASNGIIHVIDAVLMPPADPVIDPFEGIDCAVTVGVGATGYAFSPDVVTIAVGETVCWSWEDESMPHNVKEITGYKSTNFVEGGISSGAAAATVNFHHTFTEDTTFFYACEPHVALNMFGEVVVGDGGQDDDTASTVDSDDEENTPGFMVISTLIAVIGALALMGRTSREE